MRHGKSEQKGNREMRKPKKEKPRGAPVVSSFGAQFNKPSGKGGESWKQPRQDGWCS